MQISIFLAPTKCFLSQYPRLIKIKLLSILHSIYHNTFLPNRFRLHSSRTEIFPETCQCPLRSLRERLSVTLCPGLTLYYDTFECLIKTFFLQFNINKTPPLHCTWPSVLFTNIDMGSFDQVLIVVCIMLSSPLAPRGSRYSQSCPTLY